MDDHLAKLLGFQLNLILVEVAQEDYTVKSANVKRMCIITQEKRTAYMRNTQQLLLIILSFAILLKYLYE